MIFKKKIVFYFNVYTSFDLFGSFSFTLTQTIFAWDSFMDVIGREGLIDLSICKTALHW